MAKRRRSEDSADTNVVASSEGLLSSPLLEPELISQPLLPQPMVQPDHGLFSDFGPAPLTEIQDGRTFHPSPIGNAKTTTGTFASARNIGISVRDPLSKQVGFDKPKETIVCVRRKERREVIFAKNLRKRGRGGSRRRNFWSNIRC